MSFTLDYMLLDLPVLRNHGWFLRQKQSFISLFNSLYEKKIVGNVFGFLFSQLCGTEIYSTNLRSYVKGERNGLDIINY